MSEFINNIAAAKKIALDLNPDTPAHISPEVDYLWQDCCKSWQVPPESIDVVFTSNFLEHLPDKSTIESTISQAHRCLKTDGIIICLGPNIKYTHGAYWDFWDHRTPITELSLSELLRLCQFAVDLCIPRFLPYTMSLGWKPPLIALRAYLRLPIVWRLFGKQFLVIGRKTMSDMEGTEPTVA